MEFGLGKVERGLVDLTYLREVYKSSELTWSLSSCPFVCPSVPQLLILRLNLIFFCLRYVLNICLKF